jgi:hypothetical protein
VLDCPSLLLPNFFTGRETERYISRNVGHFLGKDKCKTCIKDRNVLEMDKQDMHILCTYKNFLRMDMHIQTKAFLGLTSAENAFQTETFWGWTNL